MASCRFLLVIEKLLGNGWSSSHSSVSGVPDDAAIASSAATYRPSGRSSDPVTHRRAAWNSASPLPPHPPIRPGCWKRAPDGAGDDLAARLDVTVPRLGQNARSATRGG